MAKKKRSSRQKPFWERSYKGHSFWLGKAKLGKVTLLAPGQYAWEAAGRTGATDSLPSAKSAVELAVAMSDKQLDLFQ
jgi:hypothetical protein